MSWVGERKPFYQAFISSQHYRGLRVCLCLWKHYINNKSCSKTLGLSKEKQTNKPHKTPTICYLQWFAVKGSFDGFAFKWWVHGPGAVDAVTSSWEAQRHSQNQWHLVFIKEKSDLLLLLLVIQDDNGRHSALPQYAGGKVGFWPAARHSG